jgi:N-acetylmuramoyl-L-alanine amidase
MEQPVLQLEEATAAGRKARAALLAAGSLLSGGVLGLVLAVIFPADGRGEAVLSMALPESRAAALPRISAGRAGDEAPLVVIDAGHGGFDPGATGPSGIREKNVILPIALALRERLLELGAVRVALTREDDRFLPLEARVELAESLEPDLFLSIHADSAPVEEAQGANIYVLSARASDAEALALARDFNEADGDGTADDAGLGDVEAVLAELARRETNLASARIADRLEARVRAAMPVHGKFRRGANLVVLRSARMPSLLFEAGYISNPDDAARVSSAEGRAAIVTALADAITAGLLAPGR